MSTLTQIIIISYIISYSIATRRSNDTNFLISVLSETIREVFLRYNLEYDLIVDGTLSLHSNEVLNGILKQEIPTTVTYIDNKLDSWPILKPSIVFCESFEDFKSFRMSHDLDRTQSDTAKKLRFLFYVENPLNDEVIKVNRLHSGAGHIEWYSYFIVNYEGDFIILFQ